MRDPEAIAIDTQANGRPRFALTEPSTGSITTRASAEPPPIATSPRSSDTAVSGTPNASSSRKIASSAALSTRGRVAALALAVGDRALGGAGQRAHGVASRVRGAAAEIEPVCVR